MRYFISIAQIAHNPLNQFQVFQFSGFDVSDIGNCTRIIVSANTHDEITISTINTTVLLASVTLYDLGGGTKVDRQSV